MQDVRLALHLKPPHCLDRNNVEDDGLVDNAVSAKTMLRDPKSAQSAGCGSQDLLLASGHPCSAHQ